MLNIHITYKLLHSCVEVQGFGRTLGEHSATYCDLLLV